MNKANLKSYAPKARLDFIAAVTARANLLGINVKDVSPAVINGDVAIIDGREWPAKVSAQRDKLNERIRLHGFEQTMEEVAYTWFNRFAALRFMELHEYLDHGWRVLSSRDGGLPELLSHSSEVSLSGLNQDRAREMQLAGNQDNELYKLLIVAQCNELSRSMPFLFERIDDDTELLLPENLLRTDSIVAKLVAGVPEEDWAQIEAIGWLYQFYISDKKDQVIGKVVKSEDIPAATQLFTPNWIVKYLVQNSVGRLWLSAHAASGLKSGWAYYVEPAEQTEKVKSQLDALVQSRIAEDGERLNPETIKLLDPACGSGHILVEAYDVFKAIYLERGYRLRDIPRLILEKNVYGIDIDDRAAQLSGFALLMKARADDRRLLSDPQSPPKLNVLSLQESTGLELGELATHLAFFGLKRSMLAKLIETFAHAKTFGSLIQIPKELNEDLAVMVDGLQRAIANGDLYAKASAQDVLPVALQALVLGMQFDAVVANPPYMGGKGMNRALKVFAQAKFPDSKADLFAMFIERGFEWCKRTGFNSMVTMQSWMFLSSFESMREKLLADRTIITMAHLGARAFGEISGEVVQTTAFVLHGQNFSEYKPAFFRLVNGQEDQKEAALRNGENRFNATNQDDFKKIPGSPLVYWLPEKLIDLFTRFPSLDQSADLFKGLSTGENELYIRYWFEVSSEGINFDCRSLDDSALDDRRWYPCNKGGGFRKWFGNREAVIDWKHNGALLRSMIPKSVIRSPSNYFLPCLTWSKVSSGGFSMRYFSHGFIPLDSSSSLVSKDGLLETLALVNSRPFAKILAETSPTLNYEIAQIGRMPDVVVSGVKNLVNQLISIHKTDWESNENDWGFTAEKIVARKSAGHSVEDAWNVWEIFAKAAVSESAKLEAENNRLFIEAYGLQDELSPAVEEDQITLVRADREMDSQRLISYVVGCVMGRYSLDEPGLVYANAGGIGFEPVRYKTFTADSDGIVPVTDELWFEDDIASRMREFLKIVWGAASLEANVAWLAESLGAKGDETPDETIRRYLADKFYKDHMQTYKKRPIYWLFSSGKQGAFQALVYLHRYNEGTLSRMRSEYVVPLTARFAARLEMFDKDAAAASSSAARTKIQKQIEALRKKQAELLSYDEKLRHYADMRINIDLDDGVKVNYAKFRDLVAESKAITGGTDE